jgi:hypothetical protein
MQNKTVRDDLETEFDRENSREEVIKLRKNLKRKIL